MSLKVITLNVGLLVTMACGPASAWVTDLDSAKPVCTTFSPKTLHPLRAKPRLSRRALLAGGLGLAGITMAGARLFRSPEKPLIALRLSPVLYPTEMTGEDEKRLGHSEARLFLQKKPRLNDPLVTSRVQVLGRRLYEAMGKAEPSYSFAVYRDAVADVVALPAGIILVSTAIIKQTENEAELAGVMALFMGHVASRRTTEITLQNLALRAKMKRSGLMWTQQNIERFLQLAERHLVVPRYSLLQNEEADNFAIRLLARAGLDPRVLPGLYLRLSDANSPLVSRVSVIEFQNRIHFMRNILYSLPLRKLNLNVGESWIHNR